MRNKVKLLALIYGPEDQKLMSQWISTHQEQFEIVDWSNHLRVPVQAAVAYFISEIPVQEIHGFLIDDHKQYDPIVIKRLADLVYPHGLAVFSAVSGTAPAIGNITEILPEIEQGKAIDVLTFAKSIIIDAFDFSRKEQYDHAF